MDHDDGEQIAADQFLSRARRGAWSGAELRFTVLGPVRLLRAGVEATLNGQQRALLAALVVWAGRVVLTEEIVDFVWGSRPPASATNTVHKHIGVLRRAMEPDIAAREPSRWLVRQEHGYRLCVSDSDVDLLAARTLVGSAGEARATGETRVALDLLLEALALWRGPCAADLGHRFRRLPLFRAVDAERVGATCDAADLALAAGCSDRVLSAVRQAAAAEPLDEALQTRLLLVLAANGRQAEALDAYVAVRRRLADDLGVDPAPELQAAHRRILRQDIPVRRGMSVLPGGAGPLTSSPSPRQLPLAAVPFVGRVEELGQLAELADGRRTVPVPIVLITGPPQVGKTALAVYWSHRWRSRFPDGQLYLDLRGRSPGSAVRPLDALGRALAGLGVAPGQYLPGIEERSALYRSLLAGRRMLVVLDDAASAAQVRPLLPGEPGCQVLVTSRGRLAELVARDGARSIQLAALRPEEAVTLLAGLVDASQVDEREGRLAALAHACGYRPAALRTAALHLRAASRRRAASQ